MRLTPALSALALVPMLHAPSAQAQDVDTAVEATVERPLRISFHLGAGPALARPPQDPEGDITLLYGTGFSGSAFRGAARASYSLAPELAAMAELGIGRQTISGYAEQGDLRRDLTFGMTSVELPIGLQWQTLLGDVGARVNLGLAPHVILAAKATDERQGYTSDEPAPEIRVAPQLGSFLGLGMVMPVGTVRVPIEVRGTYNLTYPNTTADRLEGAETTDRLDDGSIAVDPGAYLVDTDWVILMSIGVELVPGQR